MEYLLLELFNSRPRREENDMCVVRVCECIYADNSIYVRTVCWKPMSPNKILVALSASRSPSLSSNTRSRTCALACAYFYGCVRNYGLIISQWRL